MWPEWLTEARLAIGIAALSATFTLWQGRSAHILAVLERQKAKRKPIICESHITRRQPDDGKRYITIELINIEPHTAIVTAVMVKGKTALIVRDPSAHEGARDDRPSSKQPFRVKIKGPSGNHVRLKLIADKDLSARDIKVGWEWLDGTKT